MTTEWTYKSIVVTPEVIPEKALGFIYLITHIPTKQKYIGRKLLTSASSKMVNGKKKKIRKESDWKTYWSSSPKLKDWIKTEGTANFTREILTFCQSKGSLAYCEEMALYLVAALESDRWINDNIRSKIYRTWVKKDDATDLRHTLDHLKLI